MKTIFWLLLMTCIVSGNAEAKKKKPSARKSVKKQATVVLHPPMSDAEWFRRVKGRQRQTYVVQTGDTLSKISRRLFSSLSLWPKLWELNNPPITNPHEIEVGTILHFYHESEPARGLASLSMIKLVPEGNGLATDLEKDSIAAVPIRSRHRLQRFILAEQDFIGELTGSYADRRQFFLGDSVYVEPVEGKVLEENLTYSLVSPESEDEKFREQGYRLPGSLVRVVGEIKIVGRGEHHYKAVVTALHSEATRGMKVASFPTMVSEPAPVNPPPTFITKILMGEQRESRALYQGKLALIDKGTDEGMKPGYLFRVFQDTDPLLKSRTGLEPDSKGEILILHAGSVASVGYIRKSSDTILLGDTLIPAQAFDSPPPLPHRESSEIKVD